MCDVDFVKPKPPSLSLDIVRDEKEIHRRTCSRVIEFIYLFSLSVVGLTSSRPPSVNSISVESSNHIASNGVRSHPPI